jgi:outer membrane immunogenic protein
VCPAHNVRRARQVLCCVLAWVHALHTDWRRDLIRTFLASLTALAFASGSALAADLPLKAPPSAPPAANWTGCYVSAGAGFGAWNQSHFAETDPGFVAVTPAPNTGAQGWLGRVGGGCDYQFSVGHLGNFVVGVLGNYDFTSLSGSFQESFSGLIGSE